VGQSKQEIIEMSVKHTIEPGREIPGKAVMIRLSVTNVTRQTDHEFWGVYDIKDCWAVVCVYFRRRPPFWDPGFERTFISVNGRPTTLKDTDLSTTFKQCLPAYWVKGQKPRLEKLCEGSYNYGCGISSTEADQSWIAVESEDGKRTLIVGFPRVHHLWANRRPPVHACIHANAMIGDVPVDKTAGTTGAVMVVDGPVAEAARQWRDILKWEEKS